MYLHILCNARKFDVNTASSMLIIKREIWIFVTLFRFSQAMYERLFCWIVGRINDVIEVRNYDARVHGKNTVIGVLDIYGFEIFQNNR